MNRPYQVLLSGVVLATVLADAASAQFVLADGDPNNLGYDDCELTPDGRYAVLRENTYFTSARVLDLATGVEVLNEPGRAASSRACARTASR